MAANAAATPIERAVMQANAPTEFDIRQMFRSFPRLVLAVLLSPSDFFPAMKRRGGYIAPLSFLLLCVLIHIVMAGVIHRDPWLMLRALAMGVTFPFVTAGLLHLFLVKIFRAGGTYEAAFRVNAYAAAVNVVTWVPLAGLLMEFYRIYLLVAGLSAVYAVKASRALVAVALTMACYILASGLLATLTEGRWGA